MGGYNPHIPWYLVGPHCWFAFTMWLLGLRLDAPHDKKIIFEWSLMTMVPITSPMLTEYFRKKGTDVP